MGSFPAFAVNNVCLTFCYAVKEYLSYLQQDQVSVPGDSPENWQLELPEA